MAAYKEPSNIEEGAGATRVGDRFIVRSQRRVRVSSPTGPRALFAPSNQAMGMFVVTHVEGDGASGPLPRGTIAHVDDLAEPTFAALSVPLIGPQLWCGMGRFYGTLRPIIPIASPKSGGGNAGFGMLPGSLIVQGSVGGAWINDHCLYDPDSTNTLQCPNGSLDGVGPALGLGRRRFLER